MNKKKILQMLSVAAIAFAFMGSCASCTLFGNSSSGDSTNQSNHSSETPDSSVSTSDSSVSTPDSSTSASDSSTSASDSSTSASDSSTSASDSSTSTPDSSTSTPDSSTEPDKPHVHSFGAWEVVKEATCVEDGKRIRVCEECGETEEEVIPASGIHTPAAEWSDFSVYNEDAQPFEKAAQVTVTVYCEVCGETLRQEQVDAVLYEVVPATCEEDEYSVYIAIYKYDGKEITYEGKAVHENTALGHDYSYVITAAPTATEEGEMVLTCGHGVCEHKEVTVKLPAFGEHTLSEEYVAVEGKEPTCDEDGEATYALTVYGQEIVITVEVPAFGHDWGEWEPTSGVYRWIRYCKNDRTHFEVSKSEEKPEN